jgi:hypothetical protein
VGVEELVRVRLVGVVVLAEDEGDEVLILVDDRQLVELVLPDDIVCGLERRVSSGAVMSFSNGVMKSRTSLPRSSREGR